MAIRGICKARNEAHILKDTLDNWAQWCDGGIHIYMDADNGPSGEIAKSHPAVAEVVESTLFDQNRERAEWYCRQVVLASALRFLGREDWVVYFDADEHLESFDVSVLDDPELMAVACRSYDAYITPEDAHLSEWHYASRRWVSSEFQFSPYFYRVRPWVRFYKPDQRNIDVPTNCKRMLHGKVRHWGKATSVRLWDEKCKYYAEVFGPKYAEKWRKRIGQAVKDDMKSDFGIPLMLWEDVLAGKADPALCRNSMKLVR
jgi:hypothetical protein